MWFIPLKYTQLRKQRPQLNLKPGVKEISVGNRLVK